MEVFVMVITRRQCHPHPHHMYIQLIIGQQETMRMVYMMESILNIMVSNIETTCVGTKIVDFSIFYYLAKRFEATFATTKKDHSLWLHGHRDHWILWYVLETC